MEIIWLWITTASIKACHRRKHIHLIYSISHSTLLLWRVSLTKEMGPRLSWVASHKIKVHMSIKSSAIFSSLFLKLWSGKVLISHSLPSRAMPKHSLITNFKRTPTLTPLLCRIAPPTPRSSPTRQEASAVYSLGWRKISALREATSLTLQRVPPRCAAEENLSDDINEIQT